MISFSILQYNYCILFPSLLPIPYTGKHKPTLDLVEEQGQGQSESQTGEQRYQHIPQHIPCKEYAEEEELY